VNDGAMLDSAACFNVAFDVAFVHADAATEQKPSKVVAFEPRWMHVAYEGTWRGYRTGEFTFTPDDLRQMVGNHRANPQYRPNTLSVTKEDIQRGQYGVFRIDWRHLSEAPPAEVPIELQKARGWVLELEVRAPAAPGDVSGVRAQGNKAELWAYGYFTEEAASMINNHEVKWLSITAYPNALDKVTGGNIGWWVSSIALTPSPFLQGLTALPFQAEHPAPTATTDHDDGVLLEVVSFTRDISSHFHAIRETDTSDLAESRVRLLRSCGRNLDTDTALERTIMKSVAVLDGVDGIRHGRRLRLLGRGATGTLDELVDRGHRT
jgi:hypothetical protein